MFVVLDLADLNYRIRANVPPLALPALAAAPCLMALRTYIPPNPAKTKETVMSRFESIRTTTPWFSPHEKEMGTV